MKKSDFLLYVLAGVLGILVLAFFAVMFINGVAGVVGEWFGIGDGVESKKNTLEFLGWGISGVIAFYGLFALNRRAAAQDENNKLIEKGHVQDRFRSAVEHLSNKESVSGRIASFYEFYYLAKNAKGNKDDSAQTSAQTILDILCAHLRQISNSGNPCAEEIKTLLINVLFSRKAVDVFGGLNYDLQRVKLPKFDFRKIHNPKANVDFSDADFSEVVFDYDIDLSGFLFQHAKFHNAKFCNANLQTTNFLMADFSNATLQMTNLSDARLHEANFSGARFFNVNFSSADLSYANFSDTDLSSVDLSGTDIYLVNLYRVNFSDTDLYRTNLRGADLRGTDLSSTLNLQTAELSGAKYSKNTTGNDTNFPEGFKPEDYGMIYCPPEDKKPEDKK